MKASKKHGFRGKQAMTLGLIFMLSGFIAIIAVFNIINSNETIVSAANYSETEIADGQIYEFRNAVVFDEFAVSESTDGTQKEHYYIIGKADKSTGNWVLYSLCLNEDDALFKTLNDFAESKEAQVGDLEVTLCARASDYLYGDMQIRGYYEVAANEYNKKAFDGKAVVEKDFSYEYIFKSADELAAYNKSNATVEGVSVSLLIVFTVLSAVIFFKNLRRVTRGEVQVNPI